MKKHIIVIGGGMAGTSAAYHLRKKGYSVTILEKNDRLGGRIHSVAMHGATIELGAGFLTNIYANVLSFIARTGLDTQLYTQRSKSAVVRDKKVRTPISLFMSLSIKAKF